MHRRDNGAVPAMNNSPNSVREHRHGGLFLLASGTRHSYRRSRV